MIIFCIGKIKQINSTGMKKYLLATLIVVLSVTSGVFGQSIVQGIHYQAVARDDYGMPLANMPLTLNVSLVTGPRAEEVYFTEAHQVTTDANGLIDLVIGGGNEQQGKLTAVPWANENIWLQLEMAAVDKPFNLVSNARFLSVPYALYARTANQLDNQLETDEKNQSIYWTTAGNTLTSPPTHFLGTRDNQNLVFKTNNLPYMTITNGGQVQIVARVDGSDTNKAAYPVTIDNSNQGIYIIVKGSRSGANNYLTFADDFGIWGRVEGQTLDELRSDWQYQLQIAVFALKVAALAASIVAWGAEAVGLFASGLGAAAGAAAILSVVALGVEAGALGDEWSTWVSETEAAVGVTYQSGGADYAEWMERAPGQREFFPGEIVGVTGGQISLNTANAEHFMVVSTHPGVLGNMKPSEDKKNFTKIAFMGQVPVRVAGPVAVGDYIIPSGNHDGFAIAVHPKDMQVGDYQRIIGVAWENASGDAPFNFVNTAIGINTNDLSKQVESLEQQVDQIMVYLKGEGPLHSEGSAETLAKTRPQTTMQKIMTDDAFDQLIEDNADKYIAAIEVIKGQLLAKGVDINQPGPLRDLFNDPIAATKKMRRDPNWITQWAYIDQQITSGKKQN